MPSDLTPTHVPAGDFTANPSLKGFDGHARKIIRRALRDGWLARRSSRHHMLLYAPDGVTTTSISRDLSAPHVRNNALRPIRAWQRQQPGSIDPAAPATAPVLPDAAIDQPAPVVERRLAHLRRTAQ